MTKFLGLSHDSEDSEDDDEIRNNEASVGRGVEPGPVGVDSEIEEKEFDGVVTSLHNAYGLINNEVFFTTDCVVHGSMPKVGDRVHVVTWRKGSVGGWRAKRVYSNPVKEDFGDEEESDNGSDSESKEFVKASDMKHSEHRVLRDAKLSSNQKKQQLLMDKCDVGITPVTADFGKLVVGESASLQLCIRLA